MSYQCRACTPGRSVVGAGLLVLGEMYVAQGCHIFERVKDEISDGLRASYDDMIIEICVASRDRYVPPQMRRREPPHLRWNVAAARCYTYLDDHIIVARTESVANFVLDSRGATLVWTSPSRYPNKDFLHTNDMFVLYYFVLR